MKAKLRKLVMKDVDFLSGLGLMDYSLLLGIERIDRFNDHSSTDKHQFIEGDVAYHVSIIDFF